MIENVNTVTDSNFIKEIREFDSSHKGKSVKNSSFVSNNSHVSNKTNVDEMDKVDREIAYLTKCLYTAIDNEYYTAIDNE